MTRQLTEEALDALIARERTRVVAPLTEWRTLSAQLRSEGLMRGAPGHDRWHEEVAPAVEVRQHRSRSPLRWGVRAAASVIVIAGSFALGRATNGTAVVRLESDVLSADSIAVPAALAITPPRIRSRAQARNMLNRAEGDAQRAAAFLAAGDTSAQIAGGPELYRERLGGLDQLISASRKTLDDAPADPVLNQYYLSAVGAREATLQRLGATLPAGLMLNRF